jgi:hypothetical protein
MLKKDITFHDLDGNELTETFYFNINKAELARMELTHKTGLEDYLKAIISADDRSAILRAYEDILLLAVGQRHEDGRRFIKSDEIRNSFAQSEAYVELFLELFQADKMVEFVKGILPAALVENQRESTRFVELPKEAAPAFNLKPLGRVLMEEDPLGIKASIFEEAMKNPNDSSVKYVEDYTRAELLEMPSEQFMKLRYKNHG